MTEPVATEPIAVVPNRPRLRGVLHQYAFAAFVALGVVLIATASGGVEQTAAAVFGASVAVAFGISALYHRVTWTPARREVMRRLDHAGIFLLIAVALGWVGIVALPQIIDATGWTGAALLLAGGLLYTLGALVYALRRPDPRPRVFGYHEVFHALTIAAAASQYAAVTLLVV